MTFACLVFDFSHEGQSQRLTIVVASSIVDTSAWSEPRNLESLPAFLENFAGSRSARGKRSKNKLSNAHGEKGRPHTLVVAGAGLRAADLTRALRGFQTKESMVAKLFAKHIKLKEAMDMAKKTRMGIGVGTPQRIADLLESGWSLRFVLLHPQN